MFKSFLAVYISPTLQPFGREVCSNFRGTILTSNAPTVEEKTQLRYLEELNALRTELGVHAKLAADTTSENEENYPHYQLPGTKQKKKKRGFMGSHGLSIRGLQLDHEDETIRPVFSTLQRAEYPANRSLFVREQTEETYREMLLEHKRRRARRDVRYAILSKVI